MDSLDCIEENQRGYIGDSEKQVLKYLFLNNELFCIHIEESPQQIILFSVSVNSSASFSLFWLEA